MRLGSLVQISGLPSLYEGASNQNGICISRGKKNVKSEKYDLLEETDWEKTKKFYLLFVGGWLLYLFSIWFFCLEILENTAWPIIIFGFILSIFSLLSAYVLIYTILTPIYRKGALEYHACEHKVIALLERDLSLTLENLKKMPSLMIGCGTVIQTFFILFPILLPLSLLFLTSKTTLFIVGIIILMVILLLSPPLMQFFFFLRKPSEDKLKEALEVAKAIKSMEEPR